MNGEAYTKTMLSGIPYGVKDREAIEEERRELEKRSRRAEPEERQSIDKILSLLDAATIASRRREAAARAYIAAVPDPVLKEIFVSRFISGEDWKKTNEQAFPGTFTEYGMYACRLCLNYIKKHPMKEET